MIRKRRNNIFLYLQNFSNQNFSSKKNFGVHRPSRGYQSQIRCGTENKQKKIINFRNYEILVVQGHLQPPLTETSTSLATVTTDTRASKTMSEAMLISGASKQISSPRGIFSVLEYFL